MAVTVFMMIVWLILLSLALFKMRWVQARQRRQIRALARESTLWDERAQDINVP